LSKPIWKKPRAVTQITQASNALPRSSTMLGEASTGGEEVQGSWHDEGSSPAVDSSMSCVGGECGWGWWDARVYAERTTTAKTSGQNMEEGRGEGIHNEVESSHLHKAGSAENASHMQQGGWVGSGSASGLSPSMDLHRLRAAVRPLARQRPLTNHSGPPEDLVQLTAPHRSIAG
jgi:hypothetical protein